MHVSPKVAQHQPMFELEELKKLESQFGSPFYLLDVERLRLNFFKLKNAFEKRYKNFIIGYSYKTNYIPFLCKTLSRWGAYAEVVSRLEYDLAIKIGENPKRIIFNGPLKSKDDIELALKNGSILNLDSLYEIKYVKSFARKNEEKAVKVGLRVNFDVFENGVTDLQDGYDVSRFGLCIENGSFQAAIEELEEVENIKIVGLHGHFSTRNRTVESYRKKTDILCELAKKYLSETIEFIDIGGGIYGELPKEFNIIAPSFDDYAESICAVMQRHFSNCERKPALILEPGVSLVANVMYFFTKVIDVKKVKDQHFILVDGSVHQIKPTMHKVNLPMKIYRNNKERGVKESFNIVGYTCMEKDYLAHRVHGELPIEDDYIMFENVGAYTIVFNPPFIKERPGIVALEKEMTFMIREAETFKEFFNADLYKF